MLNSAALFKAWVQKFAEALKNYVAAGFCVPCANGTDALQIAMMALDLSMAMKWYCPCTLMLQPLKSLHCCVWHPYSSMWMRIRLILMLHNSNQKSHQKQKPLCLFICMASVLIWESVLNIVRKHNLFVIEDVAQALVQCTRLPMESECEREPWAPSAPHHFSV